MPNELTNSVVDTAVDNVGEQPTAAVDTGASPLPGDVHDDISPGQIAGVYTGYKHCCVIDVEGRYITFVQVHLMDYGGEIRQEPQYYTLADDEQLVDANPPTDRPHAGAAGFVIPRWDADASAWVETATSEEIAAWEAEHPAPEPVPPEPTVWDKMDAAYAEGVNTAYDS